MKKLLIIFCLINLSLIYAKEAETSYHWSASQTTISYNNTEFYDKLGYKIYFPEIVNKDYNIAHVTIGVGLSERLTQSKYNKLKKRIQKSIEDDSILHKLNKYGAYRTAGAIYTNTNKSNKIVVASMPSKKHQVIENPDQYENIEETPIMINNNPCSYQTSTEMNYPVLCWTKEQTAFMIFQLEGELLSQDELIKIAKSVMEFN